VTPLLSTRVFLWTANAAFHFGLVLTLAAIVSLVLGKDRSGWRRRLWQAVFMAPPLFLALNVFLPSIVVPLLSLPVTASRVMPLAEGAGAGSPAGAFPARVTPMVSPLLSWIGAIMLLGAAGSALRLAFGLLAAHRIGRRADAVEDERVLGWSREAASRLGCRRPVRLKTSPRIAAPVVSGLFRPLIVLPPDFPAWPEAGLRAVLGHEMSHVKHRDPLGRTLARIVCALNWFNPAAWTALGRLVAEQEIESDRAALSWGMRPSEYAELLLRRMTPRGAEPRYSLASLGDGAAWKARMRALLVPLPPAGKRRGRRIALGALLTGLILAPGAIRLWDASSAGPRMVMVYAGRPSGPEAASQGRDKARIWMDPATHSWDYY
jgi:beta-lactamase regulating signal transducer with metallopeptidase domain